MILTTAAALAYWFTRVGRGASEAVDVANELQNLPRKLRYRKKAGKKGLDLIDDPVEAATVLMISIARMDGNGRVSDTQSNIISEELRDHMHLDRETADDMILQLRSLSQYLVQAESTLFPMLKVLQNSVDKNDARLLSEMMHRVAKADGEENNEQSNFIRRYEDRMGLLG